MTVSTKTVRMANSRRGKNQSERSDLPCCTIKYIILKIGLIKYGVAVKIAARRTNICD